MPFKPAQQASLSAIPSSYSPGHSSPLSLKTPQQVSSFSMKVYRFFLKQHIEERHISRTFINQAIRIFFMVHLLTVISAQDRARLLGVGDLGRDFYLRLHVGLFSLSLLGLLLGLGFVNRFSRGGEVSSTVRTSIYVTIAFTYIVYPLMLISGMNVFSQASHVLATKIFVSFSLVLSLILVCSILRLRNETLCNSPLSMMNRGMEILNYILVVLSVAIEIERDGLSKLQTAFNPLILNIISLIISILSFLSVITMPIFWEIEMNTLYASWVGRILLFKIVMNFFNDKYVVLNTNQSSPISSNSNKTTSPNSYTSYLNSSSFSNSLHSRIIIFIIIDIFIPRLVNLLMVKNFQIDVFDPNVSIDRRAIGIHLMLRLIKNPTLLKNSFEYKRMFFFYSGLIYRNSRKLSSYYASEPEVPNSFERRLSSIDQPHIPPKNTSEELLEEGKRKLEEQQREHERCKMKNTFFRQPVDAIQGSFSNWIKNRSEASPNKPKNTSLGAELLYKPAPTQVSPPNPLMNPISNFYNQAQTQAQVSPGNPFSTQQPFNPLADSTESSDPALSLHRQMTNYVESLLPQNPQSRALSKLLLELQVIKIIPYLKFIKGSYDSLASKNGGGFFGLFDTFHSQILIESKLDALYKGKIKDNDPVYNTVGMIYESMSLLSEVPSNGSYSVSTANPKDPNLHYPNKDNRPTTNGLSGLQSALFSNLSFLDLGRPLQSADTFMNLSKSMESFTFCKYNVFDGLLRHGCRSNSYMLKHITSHRDKRHSIERVIINECQTEDTNGLLMTYYYPMLIFYYSLITYEFKTSRAWLARYRSKLLRLSVCLSSNILNNLRLESDCAIIKVGMEKDRLGKILELTPNYFEYLGLPEDFEAVGKSINEMLPGDLAYAHEIAMESLESFKRMNLYMDNFMLDFESNLICLNTCVKITPSISQPVTSMVLLVFGHQHNGAFMLVDSDLNIMGADSTLKNIFLEANLISIDEPLPLSKVNKSLSHILKIFSLLEEQPDDSSQMISFKRSVMDAMSPIIQANQTQGSVYWISHDSPMKKTLKGKYVNCRFEKSNTLGIEIVKVYVGIEEEPLLHLHETNILEVDEESDEDIYTQDWENVRNEALNSNLVERLVGPAYEVAETLIKTCREVLKFKIFSHPSMANQKGQKEDQEELDTFSFSKETLEMLDIVRLLREVRTKKGDCVSRKAKDNLELLLGKSKMTQEEKNSIRNCHSETPSRALRKMIRSTINDSVEGGASPDLRPIALAGSGELDKESAGCQSPINLMLKAWAQFFPNAFAHSNSNLRRNTTGSETPAGPFKFNPLSPRRQIRTSRFENKNFNITTHNQQKVKSQEELNHLAMRTKQSKEVHSKICTATSKNIKELLDRLSVISIYSANW